MVRLAVLALVLLACAQTTEPRWAPPCDPTRPDDYIPVDLEDSLVQLYCTLDRKVVREMADGTEDEMIRYHHGLGTGLRNGWRLWAGSRLSEYFNGIGLHHPDDMSGVILTSFWRRLRGEPLRVDEQVRHYQAFWAAHFEPPPILCPSGEERRSSVSVGTGELPDSYAVTYYAECPGAGWFQFTKGAAEWEFFGPEPPGDARR